MWFKPLGQGVGILAGEKRSGAGREHIDKGAPARQIQEGIYVVLYATMCGRERDTGQEIEEDAGGRRMLIADRNTHASHQSRHTLTQNPVLTAASYEVSDTLVDAHWPAG